MGKIANNIERIRNARGITQEQVADVLGVSRATYINVESGKRDLNTSELEKLSAFLNIPISELFDQPRDSEKFKQMYFYVLSHFKGGVPKTKLAKLLYLIDFSNFYDNLIPMSGVRYVRRKYGPVADVFFEMTDDLFENGKINIQPLNEAFMIEPTTMDEEYGLLSDEDKARIDRICEFWKNRRTSEIVNFTHEQKPWKECRDGEYIPYSLIIQEEPNRVYAPIA
ncbi:DUF4065 domain-containing protein [Christensenellaceae bacterium OttesenSCG-928-L17]|nr:DUF4065 domain-containing protein [Christensenellaceae bacterium OttesenSCG-928-L17]